MKGTKTIGIGNDCIICQPISENTLVNGVTTVYSKIFSGFNRGIFNLFLNVTGSSPVLSIFFECCTGVFVEEIGSVIRLKLNGSNNFSYDGLDEIKISNVVGIWDNPECTGVDYAAGGVTWDDEAKTITTVNTFPADKYPYCKLEVYKVAASLAEAEDKLSGSKIVFYDSIDASNKVVDIAAVVTNKFLSMMPSIAPFYRLRIVGTVGNGADTRITAMLVSGIVTRTM